jgi:glyoxylate reductase
MSETPQVYVTRNVPEAVAARLHRDYHARVNTSDAVLSADEIVAGAEGADALVVTPPDKVTADVIDRLPDRLKVIGCFSVGTNHVDLEAAKRRGIVVTNTPGVLTEATADIALLLILGAARRAHEGTALLRARQWQGWTPTQLMGIELGGKRLGILGMGRIGQAVARRARGFGMAIHYHNRRRLSPEEEQGATYHDDPETLLPKADVLSLHFPATPETQGFLNAERIARLPHNAIVVNTARGDVVDDEALIDALKRGRLFAAGLDVFAGEPNLHPGYYELDNAFLLPHLGSATVETRNAMGFMVLDNLDAVFAGTAPPNRVT